ncbi:MAG: tryptophan synthase subunit alpha [Ignavibacteriaceae bacterium]|nr:tryptophan synthase subunit alpha [Ignavibacteriaceae bacterium]
MSKINLQSYIEEKNSKGEKVLSIFLTAGYPDKENFIQLALGVLESGADMLELGVPFSDPLADGPVIQASSTQAIKNGVTLNDVFAFCTEIKKRTQKPVVIMSYLNPLFHYGAEKFNEGYKKCGADGLIIPDIIPDEQPQFDEFKITSEELAAFAAPTTSPERMRYIDERKWSFLYYVGMLGTTGQSGAYSDEQIAKIGEAYSKIKNNKMLVGFGISGPDDIKKIRNHCDGVIVGSLIIKKLAEHPGKFEPVYSLIAALKNALHNEKMKNEPA